VGAWLSHVLAIGFYAASLATKHASTCFASCVLLGVPALLVVLHALHWCVVLPKRPSA